MMSTKEGEEKNVKKYSEDMHIDTKRTDLQQLRPVKQKTEFHWMCCLRAWLSGSHSQLLIPTLFIPNVNLYRFVSFFLCPIPHFLFLLSLSTHYFSVFFISPLPSIQCLSTILLRPQRPSLLHYSLDFVPHYNPLTVIDCTLRRICKYNKSYSQQFNESCRSSWAYILYLSIGFV